MCTVLAPRTTLDVIISSGHVPAIIRMLEKYCPFLSVLHHDGWSPEWHMCVGGESHRSVGAWKINWECSLGCLYLWANTPM